MHLFFGPSEGSESNDLPWSREWIISLESGAGKRVLDEILAELDRRRFTSREIFGIHMAVEEALVNALKKGYESQVGDATVQVQCRIAGMHQHQH